MKNTNSLNVETRGRKHFKIPKGVNVDWSQTNGSIGERLGCSVMTAMALRRNAGKKPLPRGRPKEAQEQIPQAALKSTLLELKDIKLHFDKLYRDFASKFVESH